MPENLKFIQITDTHLLDDINGVFRGINTKNSLQSVLSECIETYPEIDFILITGDISQTGNVASYSIFRSIIQDIRVPIYCVPGNHDSPQLLQEIVSHSPTHSINTIDFGETTLVLINTCVDNKHHGLIGEQNLTQLKKILNSKNKQSFIIAIHHPPIKVNSKWLDKLSLFNQDEFINLLKHYEAYIVVLFGHIHQEINQKLSNIHLLSTPSTCHQFKTNSDVMQCLLEPPPAYRFVELKNSGVSTTKIHFIK